MVVTCKVLDINDLGCRDGGGQVRSAIPFEISKSVVDRPSVGRSEARDTDPLGLHRWFIAPKEGGALGRGSRGSVIRQWRVGSG